MVTNLISQERIQQSVSSRFNGKVLNPIESDGEKMTQVDKKDKTIQILAKTILEIVAEYKGLKGNLIHLEDQISVDGFMKKLNNAGIFTPTR